MCYLKHFCTSTSCCSRNSQKCLWMKTNLLICHNSSSWELEIDCGHENKKNLFLIFSFSFFLSKPQWWLFYVDKSQLWAIFVFFFFMFNANGFFLEEENKYLSRVIAIRTHLGKWEPLWQNFLLKIKLWKCERLMLIKVEEN